MTHPRVMAWLLALALVLGQAAALAHGLSHTCDHDHDSGTPVAVCELCVGQAAWGAALPPARLSMEATPVMHDRAAPAIARAPDTTCSLPHARAPPNSAA